MRIKGEMEIPANVGAVIDFLHSYGDHFECNMQILDKMCTMAKVVETKDPKHKVRASTCLLRSPSRRPATLP